MPEGPFGSIKYTAVQDIEKIDSTNEGEVFRVRINIRPPMRRLDSIRAKRAVAATQYPPFSRNLIFRSSEVIATEKIGMEGALQKTKFDVFVPENPRESLPLRAPIRGLISEREFPMEF